MKKLIVTILLLTTSVSAYAAEIKGTVKIAGGMLQDAVVFIERIEGKTFQPPAKPVVLDQVDLAFVPHVLPILVGTTVNFPNSDVTRHNIFSPGNVKKFDLGTYAPGTAKSVVFDKTGVIPILCHVHPEMSAFIVVLETPYFAVTSSEGTFRIKNIPSGKYTVTVWHEITEKKSIQVDLTSKNEVTLNLVVEEK